MLERIADGFNGLLLNRLIIATLSAVGGVVAATFPKFVSAFCGG